MFAKIEKHLNIMWLLLIILTVMLGVVFVGIISIDKYCDENVLENVQSEEEISTKGLSTLARNIAIALDSIEVTLRYEPDAMSALQSSLGSDNPAVQNNSFDNCLAIINNTYYNAKSQVETADVKFQEFDWYQGASRQQDGALYVSAPFKDDYDGQYYVAFGKYIKSGRYVIALCVSVDNLKKHISSKSAGYGYLVNVNGEVICTRDGENVGVNISTDSSRLPKGHDEVFKKIDNIGKKTIVETRTGDMYVSKYNIVSSLNYVIIREEGKIVNNVDGAYLKVIIAIIIIIPVMVALFIVAKKYNNRVKEIYTNKCEFIEGLALEMQTPLENIKMISAELKEADLEDNINKKVDSIIESVKSIAFDLNSAYDYSKLAIDELIIENEDYTFERILKNVESVVHSDVKKNNIYFDASVEGNSKLKLYGDNRKIEEIIINTVKYCASQTIDGGIELRVLYADLTTENVNVMLVIKDTGVGMNDIELPMFSEGLRAYSDEMEVEHSGIGLEMVKQLLKKLNGRIQVDSTKNVGSVFTIMIPQKIVIGDDSKWENEDVRTSSELTQLYGRLASKEVDYSYIDKDKENKTTKVETTKVESGVNYVPQQVKEDISVKEDSIEDAIMKETEERIKNERQSMSKENLKIENGQLEKQIIDEKKDIEKNKNKQNKIEKQSLNNKKNDSKDNNSKERNIKGKNVASTIDVSSKEKGMSSVFGKKVKRFEDMIPQPELIKNTDNEDSFDDQNSQVFANVFGNSNSAFGNQSVEKTNVEETNYETPNYDDISNYDNMIKGQNVDNYNNGIQVGNEVNYNNGIQVGNEVNYNNGIQIENVDNYNNGIQVGNEVNYNNGIQVGNIDNYNNATQVDNIGNYNNATQTEYVNNKYNNVGQEIQQENEQDMMEAQMRKQMEAQADNLYKQMTERELRETNVHEEHIKETSEEVAIQDEIIMETSEEEPVQEDIRINLLKNSVGQCGIDIDNTLLRYNNDIDAYEKIVLEFYEYSRQNANNVIALWNQHKFNEYFSAINTIKAGAEAIGAFNLANMYETQLQKGQEGDLKYVAGAIKDTLAYWKQLLSAIAYYEQSKN